MIHRRYKESSDERHKRLSALKVNPEIPLDKCEVVFSELDRECLSIAREFFVKQYIAGNVSQPMAAKTVVSIVRLCPATKMVGYEVGAEKIYENISKMP